MKGATKFDQLCHRVFAANCNGTNYRSRETGVSCGYCVHCLLALVSARIGNGANESDYDANEVMAEVWY